MWEKGSFRDFRQARKKAGGRIRTAIVLLYVIFVAAAVVWQVKAEQELRTCFRLYGNMKEEKSLREIRQLLREMEVFPVREDKNKKETFFFDNGYGAERTFGGRRSHQGIDIMTSNNRAGYFEVQSVSDGVVEQIGWLKLGGYRIGIRSPSGCYYYYAHLESYEKGIEKGTKISAGQILGTMGNTGYGREGTRGKFAVHLHFGIYSQVGGEEKSFNPYYLLEYLSEKRGGVSSQDPLSQWFLLAGGE